MSGKLVLNCILGIGFGLGERKLFDMNRESFKSLREAQDMMGLIRGLFPKVFRWQNQIRQQAHEQQFLRNSFGATRYFFEVFAPDGKGGWKSGEQAEQAVAFLPASNAFGNFRVVKRGLFDMGLMRKWRAVNTVHDSLLFEVPRAKLAEHAREIYPVMTAPSKVLVDPIVAPNGLVVDVEMSVGADWSQLKGMELAEFGIRV